MVFGDKVHLANTAHKYVRFGRVAHGWQRSGDVHGEPATRTGRVCGQQFLLELLRQHAADQKVARLASDPRARLKWTALLSFIS